MQFVILLLYSHGLFIQWALETVALLMLISLVAAHYDNKETLAVTVSSNQHCEH